MKKLLMFLGVVLFFWSSNVFAQDIRFVSPSSEDPSYPYDRWDNAGHTIQEVIDASDAGDTIFVANGTYRESIVINRDITLESWCREPEQCILSAPEGNYNPVVTISDPTISSGVITIRGFTITDGMKGVYISGNLSSTADFPVISGCIIDGCPLYGIHIYRGSYNIEFCTIVNCNAGIFTEQASVNSWIRYNIIAYNTVYGIQLTGSYLQFKNNCFYQNGAHVFGATIAYCDQWSALTIPDGVDPQFIDYEAGDYHLMDTSPCVNFINPSGTPQCSMESLYDVDESPADLGAYGGYGNSGTFPIFYDGDFRPIPQSFNVPQDADISFTIKDAPAGINLSSLHIAIKDHGYPMEVFTASDCVIARCSPVGEAPDPCSNACFHVRLPGNLHQPFVDYSYVTVQVTVSDLCPSPHITMRQWRFHASDITPPFISISYPLGSSTDIPLYGPVAATIYDRPGIGLDRDSLLLIVNGTELTVTQNLVTWDGDQVVIYPGVRFLENAVNSIGLQIMDRARNTRNIPIQFRTHQDVARPFIPGVTARESLDDDALNRDFPPPPMAETPSPAPNTTGNFAWSDIRFVVQDYESTLDLSNLEVRVTNGPDMWRYTIDGTSSTGRFEVSGTPYAAVISCSPIDTEMGWGLGERIEVYIAGARDNSSAHNAMASAFYMFETGYPPFIPTMSQMGIISLIILLSAFMVFGRNSRQ